MTDYAAVRDGLKTLLETISGLEVKDVAPETISGHTVIITPPDNGTVVEFDTSMDSNASDDMGFVLHLFVPRKDEKSAQDALDGYLARSGALSIFAAVSGHTAAGSHFLEVLRAHDYGGYKYAGDDFLGVQFDVAAGF